jgi:hypothetical protein
VPEAVFFSFVGGQLAARDIYIFVTRMLPASWQPTFLHYKQEIGNDLKKMIFWHSLRRTDATVE